jgi:S-adenosylmethionine:tRNA ribosyltransferase-isomerase
MQRADFEFDLPAELIAQHPLPERSASRLMRLDGASGAVSHHVFRDLPELLSPGDLLVFNDTRVMPARLELWRRTGGRVELLVERVLTPRLARCHAKPAKSLRAGLELLLAAPVGVAGVGAGDPAAGAALPVLTVRGRDAEGLVEIETPPGHDWPALMARHGTVPLPPYIDRPPEAADAERYQTVWASRPGAVAAPTAGLHFDEGVLARLAEVGVHTARLTLHVGAGTFQPVREGDISRHHMHSEWYEVPPATGLAIAAVRARGRRVVAVGTTSLRALESAAGAGGGVVPGSGETDIFITPGYRFRVVDALITNFHLPGSTLVMLVAAFSGREHILRAYAEAVRERYRFFSYGDVMLLLPEPDAARAL